MKLQRAILLMIGVSILLMIVTIKGGSEIDLESWYHIELNRSSSEMEKETRQWLNIVMFQQAGIVLTFFIISLVFVIFHNDLALGKIKKLPLTVFNTKGHKEMTWSDRLHHRFPGLTPHEMVLCNMLYRGLSSKQIALILNISPLSVNTARYRLRKKLKLSRYTELIYFLRKL